MKIQAREVLVLSPHTDDAIIGAGGLIYKLAKQGSKITYHAFTMCDDTLVGTEFKKGEIAREDKRAAEVLGISDVVHHDFENKRLQDSRQEILDIIYEFRNNRNLDLVIAPYEGDFHQDHSTVAQEALRASTRHQVTVLQYPVIGTSKDFNPNLFVPMTQEDVDVKVRAISCYKTQFQLRSNWFNPTTFIALLQTNGVYINTKYAEAFIQVKGTWLVE
jgi:LmbE family N-acetylglucosaminyl deacetylase